MFYLLFGQVPGQWGLENLSHVNGWHQPLFDAFPQKFASKDAAFSVHGRVRRLCPRLRLKIRWPLLT